jgi:hypothetical protein
MSGNGSRLERVNLMLSSEESEWLNQLAMEIRQQTGASVSRSEIVRAAIAALRELHRFCPQSQFGALTAAKKGTDLRVLAILAIRAGVLHC